jgi:hypothetical protein
MPFSRDTAAKLMRVIETCGKDLVTLLPDLQRELSPEEFKKAKREVGRILSVVDESLSAKVAAEYRTWLPRRYPSLTSSNRHQSQTQRQGEFTTRLR